MSEDLEEIVIPELSNKRVEEQEKTEPVQLRPVVTIVKPLVKEPIQDELLSPDIIKPKKQPKFQFQDIQRSPQLQKEQLSSPDQSNKKMPLPQDSPQSKAIEPSPMSMFDIEEEKVANDSGYKQPMIHRKRENEEEEEEQYEEEEQSEDEREEYYDKFPIPSASVDRSDKSFMRLEEVPSSQTNRPAILSTFEISKQNMYQPLKLGTTVACWIFKKKPGILRTGSSYEVYFKDDNRFVMAAKKLSAKMTSQFLISMQNKNISTRDQNYIGCVRSNFFGTQWNIYDDGKLPEQGLKPDEVRRQFAHIQYQFNLFGINGPRKMDIVIPRLTKSNRASIVRSLNKQQNQLAIMREDQPQKLMRMTNKEPTFDQKQKVYILDFRGKVKEPSVKNFILVDHYTRKDCLLFGRQTQQRYIMEFSYPLSPIQAFGICLTSLEKKLAVE